MKTINIKDIIYDGKVYPREKPSSSTISDYADALASGAIFPPIVLEKESNRLLDGYHRWKAHQTIVDTAGIFEDDKKRLAFESISVEFRVVPEGITPRLYAYSLSSQHGLRPKASDAKITAEEQYKEMPGTPMTTFCKYLGVSDKTAKGYIKHLIAQFEETRRTAIMRLSFLGWTQQEISDRLAEVWPEAKGAARGGLSESLSESGEIGKLRILTKADIDKGHDIKTVATRHGLPEILVSLYAMEGMDDAKRLETLDIKIQPYDVWNFSGCHPLMGDVHPGRIPGELICHALYFMTKPGDLVVDPMVGSGTTLDACLLMGRKVRGYDIDGRHKRIDVEKYSMSDGWPSKVVKADLIFWDPPYFDKMDKKTIGEEGYVEGSISGLTPAEYLEWLAVRFKTLYDQTKDKVKFAFLMSDWDSENAKQYEGHDGIYLWDYVAALQKAGWKVKRQIQCPLPTQQVHPDIVLKFREAKRLARLGRYLLEVEK